MLCPIPVLLDVQRMRGSHYYIYAQCIHLWQWSKFLITKIQSSLLDLTFMHKFDITYINSNVIICLLVVILQNWRISYDKLRPTWSFAYAWSLIFTLISHRLVHWVNRWWNLICNCIGRVYMLQASNNCMQMHVEKEISSWSMRLRLIIDINRDTYVVPDSICI